MIKNISKIFLLTLFIFYPFISSADVSKVVFTSPSQSIKPNTLSDAITIQTQDSSGNSEQTSETLDLEFLSSSATGEFLNSSGNPATKTMSVNTANRTFYYRDSSSGNFTLKVVATGRNSLKVWEVTQNITVSSGASNDSGGEVLSAKDSQETSVSTQSATSGAVAPEYSTASSQLEISAGGDRLTSPGSPINFQAFIKKNSVSNQGLSFSWSFGDGYVGDGALVSHMYEYHGDYAVVLNAKSGNTFAVARLKVKVVEPNLLISHKNLGERRYIQIDNQSNYEINLFNWKLVSRNKAFIFQPDTIILPNSNIKIDESMLLLKGQEESQTVLKNFLGHVVVSTKAPMTEEEQNDFDQQVITLKKETQSLLDLAISKNLVKEKSPASSVKNSATILDASEQMGSHGETLEYEEMLKSSEPEVLGETVVYEVPKEVGWVNKIINFLSSIFK